MRIITFLYQSIISIFCFCCFAPFSPKLKSEKTFTKNSELYFPNSSFVNIKNKGGNFNTYSFNNNDFSFTIIDKIKDSPLEGVPNYIKEREISTDYFAKLINSKREEIQQLCNKYNVSYFDGVFYSDFIISNEENETTFKEKQDKLTKIEEEIYLLEEKIKNSQKSVLVIDNSNGIQFKFYIKNKEDIPYVFDLLTSLENLLKPYYPKVENNHYFIYEKDLIIYENMNHNLYNDETKFPNNWKHSYEEIKEIVLEKYENI